MARNPGFLSLAGAAFLFPLRHPIGLALTLLPLAVALGAEAVGDLLLPRFGPDDLREALRLGLVTALAAGPGPGLAAALLSRREMPAARRIAGAWVDVLARLPVLLLHGGLVFGLVVGFILVADPVLSAFQLVFGPLTIVAVLGTLLVLLLAYLTAFGMVPALAVRERRGLSAFGQALALGRGQRRALFLALLVTAFGVVLVTLGVFALLGVIGELTTLPDPDGLSPAPVPGWLSAAAFFASFILIAAATFGAFLALAAERLVDLKAGGREEDLSDVFR